MALFDLFAGDPTPAPKSNIEMTTGVGRSKPKLDEQSDIKILLMDMIGSRGGWNNKDFRTSFQRLKNMVGNENADKLYTSIVNFNTSPTSERMSPEQRYKSWSGLYHSDDYVRDIARTMSVGHPMLDMSTSPSVMSMNMTGRPISKTEPTVESEKSAEPVKKQISTIVTNLAKPKG